MSGIHYEFEEPEFNPMKTNPIEKKWFLGLPENLKLKFIEDALEEGKTDEAFEIMRILLDAPITAGGVSTEKINNVFKKYLKIF